MSKPAFYNDNQFRDYPFLPRTNPLTLAYPEGIGGGSDSASGLVEVPPAFIVDFGAIMDIDAAFNAKIHSIYLSQIRREGPELVFTFRTDAAEGHFEELVFRRVISTAGEFAVDWAESSSIIPTAADPFVCSIESRWRGFLVTGDLSEGENWLAPGESVDFSDGLWQVEPARIQNLARSYVRGINLVNFPRVRAVPPEPCSDSGSSVSMEVANTQSVCLRGLIEWKEGYNCNIRQDNSTNAIVISAGEGLGEGEPCEEVPMYPEEEKQPDSPFYSGGPACSELIKSINGVTGRNLTLQAGAGFRVYADPNVNHQLVVDLSFDDFALCLGDDVDSSVSLSSNSSSQS